VIKKGKRRKTKCKDQTQYPVGVPFMTNTSTNVTCRKARLHPAPVSKNARLKVIVRLAEIMSHGQAEEIIRGSSFISFETVVS
jgi:hypothetical protein